MKKFIIVLTLLFSFQIFIWAIPSGKYCAEDESYVIVSGQRITLYIGLYSAGSFSIVSEEKERLPFTLPEQAADNSRIWRYLRERGISRKVFDYCVNINSEISVSAYSRDVTVYEIKKRGKMFIVRHVSATYDKESNTLTVDNETYPVRDNPYYGNTDDKRGAYRYVADGRFYFD